MMIGWRPTAFDEALSIEERSSLSWHDSVPFLVENVDKQQTVIIIIGIIQQILKTVNSCMVTYYVVLL